MYTVLTTQQFDNWFNDLKDAQGKRRIQMRIDRAEMGNFGDFKSVGESILEMRLDCGPGYRIYFVKKGLEIIVLLAGGTKKTQQQDIRHAQQLHKQLED